MSQSAFPDEITERYQIKEIIGSGGMGQILKAFDPKLNIDVAIKILHNLDSDIIAIRLQREAIAAGRLQHVNITRVFDFGLTSNNVPYMVMEFLEGEILSEVLSERGFLSVKETIEIFLQICNGLEHAHRNGIVHRDLKPSNIIVTKDVSGKLIIKILDFGLAQLENVEQKLTAFNTTVGSPPYMSPEQVCALEVDSRSDIYGLGCILFETLTGVLPLKGNTPIETMTMQRDLAPPLISDKKQEANFPLSLVNLVDKCLAKSPADRPQTAKELALELDSIGHEVLRAQFSTPEPEQIENFQAKTSSRKFVITIVSVIAICSVAAFATYQYFEFQSRKDAIKNKLLDQSNRKPATLKSLAPLVETNKLLGKGPEFVLKTSPSNQLVCTFSSTVQDEDLKKIEGKPVQVVELKGCRLVKGTGLKYLSNLPLEALDLDDTQVDDQSLKFLIPLKRLSTLRLSSDNLSDMGVEQIAKIKSLEILSLASENISNNSVSLLTGLPGLRFLELKSKKIDDNCAHDLAKIRLLQGISLNNTSCSEDIGCKLARLPRAKSISLEGNSAISERSLNALAKAGIKQLNLSSVALTKEEWRAMKNLKELFRLDATNSQSAPIDIKALTALENLKYLDLHASPIVDDSLFDTLSTMKLQYLDLSDTKINDKQLLKLTKMSSLVNLRLKNCPFITSEGTTQFHKFFKLLWHRDCVLETSSSGKNVAIEE